MNLKPHYAFLCQDFSALKSKFRKRKSKLSYKLRHRLYNLQHDFKPCGKLSGDSMTPFRLGHDSSTLITPPLHGRQIRAMLSISALVFLNFPFPHVLAIQGKALYPFPFPFPFLQVVFSLFREPICYTTCQMFTVVVHTGCFFLKTKKQVFFKRSLF